jgi:hypothetical protein
MKTMMTAQNLLGKINATKNTVFYCIYQPCRENDAKVLEQSIYTTTVVLPELMPRIGKINDGCCFP